MLSDFGVIGTLGALTTTSSPPRLNYVRQSGMGMKAGHTRLLPRFPILVFELISTGDDV